MILNHWKLKYKQNHHQYRQGKREEKVPTKCHKCACVSFNLLIKAEEIWWIW